MEQKTNKNMLYGGTCVHVCWPAYAHGQFVLAFLFAL